MTGAELKTLTEGFLSGQTLDETFFYLMLNMQKNRREMLRDWVMLRSFDSTITFTAADTYSTGKTLPARFLRIYTMWNSQGQAQPGVSLIGADGSRLPLSPIPFASRYEVKDVEGFYWIDIKNSTIGRTGTRAGTLHLYFLQGTADYATSGGLTEWSFPSFAHPILAYDVAVTQKGGIDWDTVNANQIPFNREDIKAIEQALAMWDARLQQAESGV